MVIASERGKLICKKTERDLLKLRKGYQPDVVHAFRTTSRRLQVLLEELSPAQGRNEKKLLKALSRIRKRAGQIRDIDVQLSALRSLRVPLEPRRKTQLTQRLLELRHKHEKRLGKLLKKEDLSEITKRLRRASKTLELAADGDALQLAQQILRSVPDGGARLDEDQLHRYRIAVKRARYAAEFAPKSIESDRMIAELKKVQDALGRWHDWFTLTQTARQHLGEIHESSLVAALHNLTRGKFREATAQLTAILRKPSSLSLVPAPAQGAKAATAKAGAAA